MATIEMERRHTLGKEAARTKAEELADRMKEKIGIEWAWVGDSIKFESKSGAAKGAKGKVDVTDTSIRVEVDLPFMLRPLKGMVESRIREKLDNL
jgi:putative polyhydroxyalkanoate system protein